MTQDAFEDGEGNPLTNTVFEVPYEFELAEDITIPAGCVLKFDGGSLSGAYTLTGNNTGIDAGLVKIFNTDVILAGSWNVTNAYPEWFGGFSNTNSDVTEAVIKALTFKRVYFTNGEYIINDVVPLLTDYIIIINTNASLKKTSNPLIPMFHIISSKASIYGENGKANIVSEVVTPNGVIALGDVDGLLYNRSTTYYSTISNLQIYGVVSQETNVQSVCIYCKSASGTPTLYYNKLLDLVIWRFNIGIKLLGDCNAFFIKRIDFAYCGERSTHADTDLSNIHETDSAILLEQLDNAFVYGNIISDVWHTDSPNAVTIYVKNKIYKNIISNCVAEVAGSSGSNYGTIIKQRADNGKEPTENIIENLVQTSNLGMVLQNGFGSANTIIGNTSIFGIVRLADSNYTNDILPNGTDVNGKAFFKCAESNVVKDGEYVSLIKFIPINTSRNIINFTISSVSNSTRNYPCIQGTLIVEREGNTISWFFDKVTNRGCTVITPIISDNVLNLVVRNSYQGTTNDYETKFFGYFEIVTNVAHIMGTQIKLFDEIYSKDTTGFEVYNINGSGTTSARPNVNTVQNGYMYFDTTLNKPIWKTTNGWVDATGTSV